MTFCLHLNCWLTRKESFSWNIVFQRPCKTCLGVASQLMPSSSSHRREPVLQSGALRLGLAVCPFRLRCLHSVLSLLLRMRRCWEGGDRCAAVTLNKLRNIMLPAAPAWVGGGGNGGWTGQKWISIPEINGTEGLIRWWRKKAGCAAKQKLSPTDLFFFFLPLCYLEGIAKFLHWGGGVKRGGRKVC